MKAAGISAFDRTFHPDEANQAITTGSLLETGTYAYNPQDHHGPTLYYAAAAIQKAAGRNSTAELDATLLRCTPLLFAIIALIFGFLAVRRITKRTWPGILFALLLGASPIFVFFATDFIQEMLLASFTMMMFWAGTNWLEAAHSTLNPKPSTLKPGTWALIFGIAAGLAFATKETSALTFAAAAIAALVCRGLKKLNSPHSIILAFAGFILTATLFYSSFGTNWHGVYNAFIAAPLSYIHRAAGSAASQGAAAHVHPWWQYLEWLFFGKMSITHNSAGLHIDGTYTNICAGAYLLICCAIPLLFRRVRQKITPAILRPFTFLLLYTAVLLFLYSAIPYKTPWCALQLQLGYLATCFFGILIFGELVVGLSQWIVRIDPSTRSCRFALNPAKGRTLITSVATSVLVAAILLTEYVPQLIRMNRNPDSKDIPFNYASASPQVKDLSALIIENLKPLNPQPSTLFAAIALPPEDTWPLPFYLRSIKDNVGYWTQFGELEAIAGLGAKPSVVVVPAEEGHLVQPLFPHLKNTKRFEMRPHVRVRAFW